MLLTLNKNHSLHFTHRSKTSFNNKKQTGVSLKIHRTFDSIFKILVARIISNAFEKFVAVCFFSDRRVPRRSSVQPLKWPVRSVGEHAHYAVGTISFQWVQWISLALAGFSFGANSTQIIWVAWLYGVPSLFDSMIATFFLYVDTMLFVYC